MKAADPLENLRARLAKRIAPHLEAHKQRWRDRMPPGRTHHAEGFTAEFLAEAMTDTITTRVRLLVPDKRIANAILDRDSLALSWRLHDGYICLDNDDTDWTIVEAFSGAANEEYKAGLVKPPFWPPNVSAYDVADALERTKDTHAQRIAETLRKELFYPDDGRLRGRPEVYTEECPPRKVYKDGQVVGEEPSESRQVSRELAEAMKAWPILACALVVSVEKAIRDDASRRRIPIPSTREAHAALTVISQGPNGPWLDDQQTQRGESFELVWNNTRRAYQLALDFGTPDFDVKLVSGILEELQEDGLRDWLLLHRFAAEHGRNGKFTWRWSEHRERSAYDRRIRNDNITDQQAAEEVTSRLWKLKRAEIRAYRTHNGKEAWVRIGPFGLLDIPAAIPRGAALESAALTLNPELYKGAHRNSDAPHFALLTDEALLLDGKRLRLAMMTALRMRYARDEGCVVHSSARSLWEDLNTEGGTPKQKRWPQADRSLQHSLDGIAKAGVLGGWDREPGPDGPDAVYTLRPPSWMVDQLVHQVPPEFGPSKVALPKNGAELVAWRKERGWSQAELAKRMAIGIATVKRTELAGTEPIGAKLAKALGAAEE